MRGMKQETIEAQDANEMIKPRQIPAHVESLEELAHWPRLEKPITREKAQELYPWLKP